MAEGFDAGSIFFALRAQIEGVQTNVNAVKQKLDELGNATQKTASVVQASGQQISETFNKVQQDSLQQSAKITAFTQRLLVLQTVISTLGQGGGAGFQEFRQEVAAASAGLQTFAGVAAALPGKTGLVIGAIAGISLALAKMFARSEEAIAALDKLTETTLQVAKAQGALSNSFQKVRQQGDIFGTVMLTVSTRLELTRTRVSAIQAELEGIPDRLRAISNEITFASVEQKDFLQQTKDSLNRLRDLLNRDLKDIKKGFKDLEQSAALENAVRETENLGKALGILRDTGEQAIELGLRTPMQQAAEEVKAAEAAMLRIIQLQAELKGLGVAATSERLSLLGLSPGTDLANILEGFGKKRDKSKAKIDAEQAGRDFGAAFSEPLAANIGDAVFSGILEGKEAVEILGDVAKNVFSTGLSQAIGAFQKGMTATLTAIGGQAGGVIGNILTGIAGIAAGIFLNRQGESTNTFSDVQGRIESTQAVRGVVAGPSSIPIASVGSNLERAFIPVNAKLDRMIEQLGQLITNTSGGAGAGGRGFAFAETTPTS